MTTHNQSTERLLSLDALRGFDMIWILGAEGIFKGLLLATGWSFWSVLAVQFEHSEWHGFRFYDLIFPLFIFLSGVTLGISKRSLMSIEWQSRVPIYTKAIKRLFLLCFLGILYNHSWGQGIPFALDDIRYASVLMRIGVAWFIGAMIVWHCTVSLQIGIAIALLIAYWILLAFIPTPAGFIGQFDTQHSWNSWIDQHWLPGITYRSMATDPEGLLSNLPAIVNALAGAFAGRWLVNTKFTQRFRLLWLVLASIISLIVGYSWGMVFPINKILWSSSFVLVTLGWSGLLLALFYLVIDVFQWRSLGYFFAVIGVNAILLYLCSAVIDWQYINSSLFGGLIQIITVSWQLLINVVSLILLQWYFAYFLFKKNIYFKI